MPNYTIPIPQEQGGGEYHVNASDLNSAYQNVGMQAPSGGGGGATVNPNTIYSPTGGGGGMPGTIPIVNTEGAQQAIKNAMDQANQVYLNAKLNLDTDKQAFDKATEAFNQSVTTAGLTGLWQGQPTLAAQEYYANTFGTWGTPTGR